MPDFTINPFHADAEVHKWLAPALPHWRGSRPPRLAASARRLLSGKPFGRDRPEPQEEELRACLTALADALEEYGLEVPLVLGHLREDHAEVNNCMVIDTLFYYFLYQEGLRAPGNL